MPRSIRIRLILMVTLSVGVTTAFASSNVFDVSGTWTFRVVAPHNTSIPTVTLSQDGEKLSGTYKTSSGTSHKLMGTVKGDSLTFTFSLLQIFEGPPLTYSGILVNADSIVGRADFARRDSAKFTAVRRK